MALTIEKNADGKWALTDTEANTVELFRSRTGADAKRTVLFNRRDAADLKARQDWAAAMPQASKDSVDHAIKDAERRLVDAEDRVKRGAVRIKERMESVLAGMERGRYPNCLGELQFSGVEFDRLCGELDRAKHELVAVQDVFKHAFGREDEPALK
jgi:hypothetical protein